MLELPNIHNEIITTIPPLRIIAFALTQPHRKNLQSPKNRIGNAQILQVDSLTSLEKIIPTFPADIIACHLGPEIDSGLVLPLCLLSLRNTGIIKALPSLLWICDEKVETINSYSWLIKEAGFILQVVHSSDNFILSFELLRIFYIRSRSNFIDDPSINNFFSNENDLISSIITGERLQFRLLPQFDLDSRQIIGAEALIVLDHSEFGEIDLDVLEKTIKKLDLGVFIFHFTAIRIIEVLKAINNLRIAVPISIKVSGKTLCTPHLVDNVLKILGRTGLNTSLLKIELTEDQVCPDSNHLFSILNELHSLGFGLTLGNFGASNATLNLCSKISFCQLKIKGELAYHIGLAATINSLPHMFKSGYLLNKQVVVIQLDSESLIRDLRSVGCRYGQGSALSGQLNVDELINLLQEKNLNKTFKRI